MIHNANHTIRARVYRASILSPSPRQQQQQQFRHDCVDDNDDDDDDDSV